MAETSFPRRDFLKVAGAGAGLLMLGGCGENPEVPGIRPHRHIPLISGSPDIIVIGAGAWGGWTAFHLRRMGANVTLVDAYGPGNSRSTSGDESRGVRSSYGDRDPDKQEMWMLWAREAMKRWRAFDDEWGRDMRLNLFHTTGDLMFRDDWEPFLINTKKWWDKHHIPYQVLDARDVAKEFPVISIDDINVVMYEPDAGVVRARRSCQAVAAAFERLGGRIVIGRVQLPFKTTSGRISEVTLDTGQTLRADSYVFAPGPWLAKSFPEIFTEKMRTPLGYVCYFGTPMNEQRFTYPNIPSYNFQGVTGWAALPVDSRGFRVRGSERQPGQRRGNFLRTPIPPAQTDPDLSDRWAPDTQIAGMRAFVAHRFPLLKDAPLLQTHSCHYEISSNRDFIVTRHPQITNLLIAGGGNAEGFKFGPVMGQYVAQRAMGDEGNPDIAKAFALPEHDFEKPPAVPAQDTTFVL
jgi:glycine/D-amino acid oxidase-like deaminating enzyme